MQIKGKLQRIVRRKYVVVHGYRDVCYRGRVLVGGGLSWRAQSVSRVLAGGGVGRWGVACFRHGNYYC